MAYFAKLVYGRYYKVRGKSYENGVEVGVSKEDYDYLKTVVEKKLTSQGNRLAVIDIPRFALREVDPTQEERVLEEIKDAPEKLGPKKPGRHKAD